MDLNLPQSKSVPTNLIAGRRHRLSISGSGSYQSHLSSLGYFHRVRTHSEQISLGAVDSGKDDLHVLESGLAEQSLRPRIGRLGLLVQFLADPAVFLLDDLRRICSGHVWRPRTFLTLYCCFCALFSTFRIHTISWQAIQTARPAQRQTWRPTPDLAQAGADDYASFQVPLMNVTLSQRLSIAFRELSPLAHLDTFVVRAQPGHTSDLAACFWIEDARIEEALASATAWPGPVSLVVVTTHAPRSTAYEALIGHLITTATMTTTTTRAKTETERAPTNACVHVLYVPSVAGSSSNTYLDMARFLAPTSRVILFPDGIPKSMRSAESRARWLDKLPVDAPHPIVVSNATQHARFSSRSLPAGRLAPVVLPKDYPVWCPERLYLFGSRALDWEDCLWKLWLESAGEGSSIAVPHLSDGFKNATAFSVPSHAMKIRHRWSTKYRSEACAFALKRSQALESMSKTEKSRMQWRKKFCRETVAPGALDIS